MAQPEDTLAPLLPVKSNVEIDAPLAAGKAHLLFDPALNRVDAGMGDYIAGICFLDPRITPFQIGDLGFARRLEDAVPGIPVGLQRDLLKGTMGDAANDGVLIALEA